MVTARITGGAPPADRFDVAIVGSGFGGSVMALRLAERGHRVVVLEQGRRIARADIEAAETDVRQLLWAPRLRMHGYLAQHVLRDVAVLGGVGVGGGSLVYGAVLLEPDAAVLARPGWRATGVDWAAELAPHLRMAARMLGRTTTPRLGVMDEYLRRAARALGAEGSFGPTPTAIYFGKPGIEVDDPYFDGAGPRRTGCTFCGACLAGCPRGAKNSLDRNYLHLAERLGAECRAEHRVERIVPAAGGYLVAARSPLSGARQRAIRADRVVLAAGVLGTVELLLRCRDILGTLPHVSPMLGHGVRTNGEAIVGVEHDVPEPSLPDGVAISSHVQLGDTHITQNRLAPAQSLLRLAATPMIDDAAPGRRAVRTLAATALAPGRLVRRWRSRDWWRQVTVLTAMQHQDSELRLALSRSQLAPWRRVLDSRAAEGRPPAHLPAANAMARALARVGGGRPFSLVAESLGNRAITAHILGGCAIAPDATRGVVDASHEVFGHPGLFVVDGSVMPGNIGVNPSLTITALAERCAAGTVWTK